MACYFCYYKITTTKLLHFFANIKKSSPHFCYPSLTVFSSILNFTLSLYRQQFFSVFLFYTCVRLPERFRWQYTEARLLQHLPDLVSSSRHSVGLHFSGGFVVSGELHVSGKVGDGETIAFFLLDLGNVKAAVLLLMRDPAKELFEDWMGGGTERNVALFYFIFHGFVGFLPSLTARDRMSKTGVQPNVLTKDVGFNCEGEVCVIS